MYEISRRKGMQANTSVQRKGMLTPKGKRSLNNVVYGYTLKEMFRTFKQYKMSEGLAATTLNDYEIHFGYLLDFIGGDLSREDITDELFRDFTNYMLHTKGVSPVTANVRIRTMRAFMRFCYNEGYIDTPIHEKFKPVKTPHKQVEAFTPLEVRQLLNVIDDSHYTQYRDKVLILTLLDTMCRISELLAVKRSNVNVKDGYIELQAGDTKTRKARTVPLSFKTAKLLSEYMEETNIFGEDTLFLTYNGKPLNDNTVRKRLMDYKELAGIKKRVSPHVFRHTGALLYLLNGGSAYALQSLLGHTDMNMTRRYVNMTDTHIKDKHNMYSPLNAIFKR